MFFFRLSWFGGFCCRSRRVSRLWAACAWQAASSLVAVLLRCRLLDAGSCSSLRKSPKMNPALQVVLEYRSSAPERCISARTKVAPFPAYPPQQYRKARSLLLCGGCPDGCCAGNHVCKQCSSHLLQHEARRLAIPAPNVPERSMASASFSKG